MVEPNRQTMPLHAGLRETGGGVPEDVYGVAGIRGH